MMMLIVMVLLLLLCAMRIIATLGEHVDTVQPHDQPIDSSILMRAQEAAMASRAHPPKPRMMITAALSKHVSNTTRIIRIVIIIVIIKKVM